MIPLQLSLSGFLSYRDPVQIDLQQIDLACISGPNGAGKSSLLDAITWVLFGQARRRDDALINNGSNTAEVQLIFLYEGNVYKILRLKPREKSTILEFFIKQPDEANNTAFRRLDGQYVEPDSAKWKPLTERTLRETEARIVQTLRMDYDTFVNASFFLQGRADQFTQQNPAERKRILSSILGLEVWEEYRQRAADRRKLEETEILKIDGQLQEINSELAEELDRKNRLVELNQDLERLEAQRKTQESVVDNIRIINAALNEQQKLVEALARQLKVARDQMNDLTTRQESRRREQESHQTVAARSAEVEKAYRDWQQLRIELERWEQVAGKFREHEKLRDGPLREIQTTQAQLEQELITLNSAGSEIEQDAGEIAQLEAQTAALQLTISRAEEQLQTRTRLDEQLQTARQQQAEVRAENPRLKREMDELKERIDQLEGVEGVNCPVCGKPLSASDRESLIEQLKTQGSQMGDRYRQNLELLKKIESELNQLETAVGSLAVVEQNLRTQSQELSRIGGRLELLQLKYKKWLEEAVPRRIAVEELLRGGSFAREARDRLAVIDSGLKEIGYDAEAHDAVRRSELAMRSSEAEMRALEKAQASLEPLSRELADIEAQLALQLGEVKRLEQEYRQADESYQSTKAQAPSLADAENLLLNLQEQENRLRMDVGAAQQKVLVLDDLKIRRQELGELREDYGRRVQQFRVLERAFSNRGVPALLIEQALPQIETKANELLDRLSGGGMSVRFITQAEFKDKKRQDLRETLDIQVSDSAGVREYEMFSGGEAFRIDFAIRLALSEILAQRAGARLQTLVIDEGFGSQDAQGRQRLVEAINTVHPDFAKILVITHIDELKDVFPNRIEVEKTGSGSSVRVI